MSGKTLLSLISLGLVNAYTTLKDPPVPVPAANFSSTTGFTNPKTDSVTTAFTNLPSLSVVAVPICFFFAPVPIVMIGST